MGYTTHANCDLLGLGVSAISHVGDSLGQNWRDLRAWESAIDAGRLPLWRGLALSADDRLRAAVIAQLMCQDVIDIAAIEQRHGIDFAAYFRADLERLEPHLADGLVRREAARIAVTPAGRLLLRSIAMCFDAYLNGAPNGSTAPGYSKVV